MVIQQSPLTDAQSAVILEFLGDTRQRKYSLILIVEAIFWLNRTGCQWRNLDSKFPKWQLVYYYYRKWMKQGTWSQINAYLVTLDRQIQGKEDTPTLVCIDSQSVKVPQFIKQEVGIDGNKKINGRKRHAIVDTLGNIFCVVVHAANHFDGIKGRSVWDFFTQTVTTVKKVLADAGYKGLFTAHVQEQGYEIEIAARPPTERGFVPVKKRWVVERTFSWFNFFRRLDKDREKTTQSSETMVEIAQIQILLNRHFNFTEFNF
jgi:putative transposase